MPNNLYASLHAVMMSRHLRPPPLNREEKTRHHQQSDDNSTLIQDGERNKRDRDAAASSAGSFSSNPTPSSISARSSASGVFLPNAELSENDSMLCLTLDLPGVQAKDLDVTINEGILYITGIRRKFVIPSVASFDDPASQPERQCLKKYQFSRRFALDTETVDVANVRAQLERGELLILAPKRPRRRPQVYRVKVAERRHATSVMTGSGGTTISGLPSKHSDDDEPHRVQNSVSSMSSSSPTNSNSTASGGEVIVVDTEEAQPSAAPPVAFQASQAVAASRPMTAFSAFPSSAATALGVAEGFTSGNAHMMSRSQQLQEEQQSRTDAQSAGNEADAANAAPSLTSTSCASSSSTRNEEAGGLS